MPFKNHATKQLLVGFSLLLATVIPSHALVVVYSSGNADAGDIGVTAGAEASVSIRDASLLGAGASDFIVGDNPDLQASGTRTIPPSGPSYALLSFDDLFVSSHFDAPNNVIDTATLWVYQNANSGLNDGTLSVYGLQNTASDWVESEVSYDFKNAAADAGNLGWDGAGGNIDAVLTDAAYSTYNYTAGNVGWVGIDITTALQAYQAGSIGGLVMTTSGNHNNVFSFDSEHNPSGNSLILEVDIVPEPAAIGLIAVCGSFAIFHRLRRRNGASQ